MTTLKTLFSSSPTIFFCLDVVYYILASLLINISNLSITKQISNWDIKLTCFGYLLDCPRLRFTETKDAKGVYISGACIKGLSVGATSTGPFSVVRASITGAYVGVGTEFSGIG